MKRPSVAAAFAASLLFGVMSPGIARDLPWVEPVHTKDPSRLAELRLLDAEVPPLYDQPSVMAGLRDHLHFVELASVDELLERGVAIEIAPPQPIIAIADNVAPPVESGPVSEDVLTRGRIVAEAMLGDGLDEERLQAYLPFERRLGVSGVISGGSFEASAVAAGVPAPALLEAMQALTMSVDLKKEMRDGDKFYVRYEQTFTQAGAPLDVGRVLWMELRTPKGVMAIHRFRTRDNSERFWMASGQAAMPPSFRLPLDTVSISSGFGLRADPFDQPPPPHAGKPQGAGGPQRPPGLPPGLPTGGATDMPRAGLSAGVRGVARCFFLRRVLLRQFPGAAGLCVVVAAVVVAVAVHARRRRPGGTVRHAGRGGGRRARRRRGAQRALRQLDPDRAWRQAGDSLRPSLRLCGWPAARQDGVARRCDRLRRQHRPLDRRTSSFRASGRRQTSQPDHPSRAEARSAARSGLRPVPQAGRRQPGRARRPRPRPPPFQSATEASAFIAKASSGDRTSRCRPTSANQARPTANHAPTPSTPDTNTGSSSW